MTGKWNKGGWQIKSLGLSVGKIQKALENSQVLLERTIPVSWVFWSWFFVFVFTKYQQSLQNLWTKISLDWLYWKQTNLHFWETCIITESTEKAEPAPHPSQVCHQTRPPKALQGAPIDVCPDGMLTHIGPACNWSFVIYKKLQTSSEGCTWLLNLWFPNMYMWVCIAWAYLHTYSVWMTYVLVPIQLADEVLFCSNTDSMLTGNCVTSLSQLDILDTFIVILRPYYS